MLELGFSEQSKPEKRKMPGAKRRAFQSGLKKDQSTFGT
jgi:hypothetical protein